MNQKVVGSSLKQIFKKNVDKNICIFIDGDWGIGKTYSVNSLKSDESDEELTIKYVSVFGKNELEQIEKDLIMQLMPISDKTAKMRESNTFKFFGNVVTEAMKFGGVDLNFSDLLNNLKIENVSSSKLKGKVILCIDDLERKSPNVDIKDLLGLIERASTNFSVIFIANSAKLGDDTELFIEYKEKLIDYQFKIDEIDLETLEKVAALSSTVLDHGIQKLISQVYYNFSHKNEDGETGYKNIRIFKKCVELLEQIYDNVKTDFPHDYFEVNEDIINLCIVVIEEYFYPSSEAIQKKKSSIKFKKVMYETFKSIFLNESYDHKVIADYLIQNSEISKDIRKVYFAYKLNETELGDLLKKIRNKIDENDKLYFKEPGLVVSIFDAFDDIGELSNMNNSLLNLAISLYTPSISDGTSLLKTSDWIDFDHLGNEKFNPHTRVFINTLNSFTDKIYEEFILKEYDKAICDKNISGLYNLIGESPVTDEQLFEKLFDLAFEMLSDRYEVETWRFICHLITMLESNYVKKFLENKEKLEQKRTVKLKYKQLLLVLDEFEYHESLGVN